MNLRLLLAAVAALTLSACATVTQYDAAGDVHALLVAIRDSDKAAFNAHVDRPALKAQLRARLVAGAMGRQDATGWAALAAMAALPGVLDTIMDRLLQPDVFLAVAEANGYAPSKPLPGRALIGAAIRTLDAGRACVTTQRGGPCVLIFTNEAGVWRLTAFEGGPELLRMGKALRYP
jgi:uncharacterized protein YceK